MLEKNVVPCLTSILHSLQKQIQFNIDPWEPAIATVTGLPVHFVHDTIGKPNPTEAWGDTTEQISVEELPDQE